MSRRRGHSLPPPQSDLLEILVSFYDGDDAELKENARQTLSTQSSVALDGTLSSHDTAPAVLAYFVASGASAERRVSVNNPERQYTIRRDRGVCGNVRRPAETCSS
ncbi:MAG: hypothetical protein IPQ00_03320 [Chloracidobacterium sp.]|nr:hypothetical protein [Chloracidobacterium sp.]